MTRAAFFLPLLGVGLLTAGCRGGKNEFPSRPLTLICPWSAGGGTDRLARQVAVQLKSELGVPVNVVNATGGGGVTGHTRGALARPDGYTVTMGTVELNMLHHRGLCGIGPDDFEPLGLLNRDSAAIFVRNDSEWKTLGDLEAAVRSNPGPLKASGTASGGIWHVAMVGWLARRGLPTGNVTWISINGSAPSLQELLSGGLDFVCCSVPEARPLLEAEEIRCFGVMSEDRLPSAPAAPTFREQGIDWSLDSWRGLLAPKGVAPDRLAVLRDALREVSHSTAFAAFMDTAGFQISLSGPEEFGKFMRDTDRSFGEIFGQPVFVNSGRSVVGPYSFPLLIGLLGLGFLVPVIRGFRRKKSGPDDQPPVRNRLAIVAVIAGVLLFVWLCPVAGYLLATAGLLFGLLLVFRAPRRQAVVVTLVATPLLYQIFAGFLGVPLPWGWLGW